MEKSKTPDSGVTRRDFVKRTAALGLAGLGTGLLGSTNFAYAAGSDRLRIGMIGCGGRGTGAANNALNADPSVEIYAMGDLFADRLKSSRDTLTKHAPGRMNVTDDRCFSGFDNYKAVMESGVDYVILATPPGFRPIHVQAGVDRNVHMFIEKPVAVDSAGVRAMLKAGEEGKRKGLSMVAGTQYRRQPSYVEAMDLVHSGGIGDLVGGQAYYLTGPIWLRDRKPEMSDMEWQCRNWYYFTWASGDHIVEQFIHNIDAIDWAFQSRPERAIATGGRLVRTDPSYGHIYDHFGVEYQYPNGARVLATCRQMKGATSRVANRIVGTEGIADINPRDSHVATHKGKTLLRHTSAGNNPYDQTHADMIASIRNKKPINDVESVSQSTLTAILGREAAYTGQELTRDEVLNAKMSLGPSEFAFGPMPEFEVAKPGVTSVARSFSMAAPA